MKQNIHPKIYSDCQITCACGNSFITTSTRPSMSVEICSACHPFYTGTQKFVDTEGRIDKFKKKLQITNQLKKSTETKTKPGKSRVSASDKPSRQPTLKEMLEQARQQSQ